VREKASQRFCVVMIKVIRMSLLIENDFFKERTINKQGAKETVKKK